MESRRKEAFILNLNKKAQSLYSEENSIETLLLFQRAEILLKDFPVVKLQLLTYNNMASYYLKQNNLELSMDYLAYCSKLQPIDLSSFLFQIGSLLNLSALKSKSKRHKEALSSALKALHLLDEYPNECLSITCYHAISLEYLHLNQGKSAEEYFEAGFKASNKFFGPEHWISQSFAAIRCLFTNSSGELFNEICILGGNFPQIRRSSIVQVARRKASIDVERKEDITINTTPWLEHDEWKVMYVDQRKRYHKKMSPYPEPSKSVNLNIGLLDKIDRIVTKSKMALMKSEKKKMDERVGAAIVIQRAFRKYLRLKGRKYVQKNSIGAGGKMWVPRLEGKEKRTQSELKGKSMKAKYREFLDAQIKGFRKEG